MGSNPRRLPSRRPPARGRGIRRHRYQLRLPSEESARSLPRGVSAQCAGDGLEIVSRVREAVPPQVPVTLKMRRGIDASPASADRFWTIFDGAFARGVAAITVHGRTVQQKYVGPSNWEFLAAVKRHAGSRTVIGSGDLFSAEACVAMLRQTGVDGVSIARGGDRQPVDLPTDARTPGRRSTAATAHDPPAGRHAPRTLSAGRGTARRRSGRPADAKVCDQYARLHPEYLPVRTAFVDVKVNANWSDVLARFYTDDGPGRDPAADIDENDGVLAGCVHEKHDFVSFFLGKRSLLVLRFRILRSNLRRGRATASSNATRFPSLALRACMGIGIIREGLPVSREPALLGHRSVSADWSAQAGCRSAVSIE